MCVCVYVCVCLHACVCACVCVLCVCVYVCVCVCVCVHTSKTVPFLPRYMSRDMTRFSRRGSIAGFVTCAQPASLPIISYY
jgi:hypothetical protein